MEKNLFVYIALSVDESELLDKLTAQLSEELNITFTRQKFLLKLMKDYSQNLKN